MSYYLDEIIGLEKATGGKELPKIKLIALGYITALASVGIWKDGKILVGVSEENVNDIRKEVENYLDANK